MMTCLYRRVLCHAMIFAKSRTIFMVLFYQSVISHRLVERPLPTPAISTSWHTFNSFNRTGYSNATTKDACSACQFSYKLYISNQVQYKKCEKTQRYTSTDVYTIMSSELAIMEFCRRLMRTYSAFAR